MKNIPLTELYPVLNDHFGHRGWWPGRSRLEIIIGAILTQNTNWKNAAKAIHNLKTQRVLHYKGLLALPLPELTLLIRPSGYFNQKALKIKAFVYFLRDKYGGSLKRMFAEPTESLRAQLLNIRGIGPETADCILLYAGEHLSFVIDLYTWRVMTRHGWADEEIDYYGLKDLFESRLPKDLDLYRDFHAQLVAVGHHFCRKTPQCEGCPLEKYL